MEDWEILFQKEMFWYEYSTSYMGHLNNITGEWDIQISYN